jgi:hypothetical protein
MRTLKENTPASGTSLPAPQLQENSTPYQRVRT